MPKTVQPNQSESKSKQELNSGEIDDARKREAPSAAVVYEAIRNVAEAELNRPPAALAWSALAAGLSMGFSLIAQALLYSHIPDESWRPLISSFGYSIGFLCVILGRQQLFTENTLTPVLEVLRARNFNTVRRTLNLWVVVLVGNMAGTAFFAGLLANFDILNGDIDETLNHLSEMEYMHEPTTMFVRAIFAGWLVALMLWMLPSAETARVSIIILVTYIIGLAHFPHIVAGSVSAFYSVFTHQHSLYEFVTVFFLPTLSGNMVGGVLLVAAVNYAQVAYKKT